MDPSQSIPPDVDPLRVPRYHPRTSDEVVEFSFPNINRRSKAPSLNMAYESSGEREDPLSPDRRRRYSVDDARREEYWKGYYDRKRKERERESEHFSEFHTRPQRYLEYPRDDNFSRPLRATSVRSSRPATYRGSTKPFGYMHDSPMVQKHVSVEDDDDDDEGYIMGERPVKSHPSQPPPRRGSSGSSDMRIPFTSWMNKTLKGHFVAAMGEFVGTTMFLFFAFAGTQVANVGGQNQGNSTTGAATGFSPSVLLYISLVFGFSLMVNVWVFFRISGGLFNPAVTLAMALTRAIGSFRAVLLVAVQIAGSIFASFLVKVLFPTEFKVRTTLSAETSLARGVFIEAILTFELIFTIFLLAKEKHKATFIAPIGIGLALFVAELVGVYYTGGSLNPARSFGPCVVTGIFDREHWVYWVGPGAGSLLAVIFYKFIKMLEYEIANPGQEAASEREAKLDAAHKV